MKEFLKTEIFVPSARGMISDDLIFKINLRVNAVVIYNGKTSFEIHNKKRLVQSKSVVIRPIDIITTLLSRRN